MNEEHTTTKEQKAGWQEAAAESAQKEAEEARPPRAFKELLPVRLTERELAERAKRASAARKKIAAYEEKKKEANDSWKEKISAEETVRDELLDAIDLGTEERLVEVVERFEFRTGTVTITRTDTGEQVAVRAMSAAERQPNLPGTDAPASSPADEGAGDDGEEEGDEEDGPEDLETRLDRALAEDGDEDDDDAITDPQAVLDGATEEEAAVKAKRRSARKKSAAKKRGAK